MTEDQHEINRYFELVYSLGVKREESIPNTYIHIGRDDYEFADIFLKQNIQDNSNCIISAQICVKYPWQQKQPTEKKAWSVNNYITLLDRIQDKTNAVVIIHGTSFELLDWITS